MSGHADFTLAIEAGVERSKQLWKHRPVQTAAQEEAERAAREAAAAAAGCAPVAKASRAMMGAPAAVGAQKRLLPKQEADRLM